MTMDVDERLNRLETTIRRQRQGFCVLVLSVLAWLAVGPSPAAPPDAAPKALTVSKLSVQDSKGRERMVLLEGTLTLKDEKGVDRVALFTNQNDVAQLEFFDTDGTPRIVTSTGTKGVAISAFYDPSGPTRIVTGVDKEGGAFVRMNDAKGRRRYDIGTEGDDRVLEAFYDLKDNVLINVGALQSKPFIKLFDGMGKVLAAQP